MENCLLNGYNQSLNQQLKVLEHIVMSSKLIRDALERAKLLPIGDYYIGAGSITQTVWNYLSSNPLDYGIKDIDLVYFDEDLSYESENKVIETVNDLFSDFKIDVDVKNQARVHLWYNNRFGKKIEPYKTLESAINSWPTTATAIGIRKGKNNEIIAYAPFGLNDLFGKIVRPNKVQITEQIYDDKVSNWITKWPDLKVIPW